jgi:hypothetical protein
MRERLRRSLRMKKDSEVKSAQTKDVFMVEFEEI